MMAALRHWLERHGIQPEKVTVVLKCDSPRNKDICEVALAYDLSGGGADRVTKILDMNIRFTT